MSRSRQGRRSWRGVAVAVAGLAACAEQPRVSPFARADSLREEGLFRDAHPLYRALRDSLAAAGDTTGWWRAELWWAQTLMRLGHGDSAAAAIEQTFRLARNDGGRLGWTRLMKCGLWSRQGQTDSAVAECTRGLEAARRARDGELEARLHFQLGTVHSRRGRFRLSVAETERALELERRHGRSRYQLAGVLNSMGIEYAAVGRLGEAERMYQEGMQLAQSFGAPWYALHLASNRAHLRATSGDPAGAIEFMSESLRDAEQLADTQAMVYALNSMAEFYHRGGNRTAARASLEHAAAINQRVIPIYRLITLVNLGLLDATDGRFTTAQQALSRARELADAADFGLQGVQSRVGLSAVALARGAPAEALRWADEAVRIAEALESPEVLIDALEARGRAREAVGRPDAADAFLAGIDLLESWRGRLALGDLAVGVADPRWDVYEGAIRVLLAQGRAAEAFAVAERGRARLLLQIMAERDASQPPSSRAVELGRRLRQRVGERAAAWDEGDQVALDREIAAITDSLTRLTETAAPADPARAAHHQEPASLGQIREHLLASGRSLVAFFWGDSAVYGWSVSAAGLRAARLGSADSLAARVSFLTSALTAPRTGVDWRPAAAHLYLLLLGPLAPLDTNVVAIPDGPLARLPLEVLLPPGEPPLGATHLVTYAPSASVGLALARAAPRSGDRGVLAVGNPAAPNRAVTALRDARLGPLPFAAEEARDIHELFRAQGSDLLVGRLATLENWYAREPGRFRYLHFAAHAIVDDRMPDRTRVVLANGDLTLPMIRQTNVSADLVTLSACETALGRQVRGEGVIGLPHAFLSAGARGVVVTLWRVQDRGAAEFMREFYAEVAAGTGPAQALRTVRRRWILEGNSRSDPAAWAAFVLVGRG
ncbi:MAG TPA: CHAT domain-containing tetratricopeptide repeat protein [Gemmatimonadales bacterium]|nr:CHAT domain-containing tetratricopeptide repeat protein [Gemmatimonadales bacterium]